MEIQFRFTVDGYQFKAVSVFRDGDLRLDGNTMSQRAPNAIGEKDTIFLGERCDREWSPELWDYCLVAELSSHEGMPGFRCFHRSNGKWVMSWASSECIFGNNCLMVCNPE